MQTNKYIGDEKFAKMLEHYKCPTPIEIVKMRFGGAICSPNLELRPTDVISSFWPVGQSPRLETKDEADLFFKFFMGLWDELFEKVKLNKIHLDVIKANSRDALKMLCSRRYEEIENGYVEGFWGGKEDLKLPAFVAEIIDSLSDLANLYLNIMQKMDATENLEEIESAIHHTDRMVEKAMDFIIENSVLPRIDDLKRAMN